MSLEKEAEKLLTWPPLSTYGQPHPVVLERRADTILNDLKEKTLSIVEMAIPHILLCCQGTWPSHLFYFIKGLRQPKSHHLPIVILFPKDPSADQWGLLGIFKDVYLIKGSPTFELDLMRGGVLQAGVPSGSL
jgi:potassium large conductance calcium-activated channel subfamily M alpha protein 1